MLTREGKGTQVNIDIIALAPGARAPEAADWISIETLEKGRYNVAGCVGGEVRLVFANEMFECFEDAELAGVFWAQTRGVKTLYVEGAPD